MRIRRSKEGHTSYDGDSNLILSVDRQRFDNDPTTATGDVAGPALSNVYPSARVPFVTPEPSVAATSLASRLSTS